MGWTFMGDKPASADAYFREQLAWRYTVLDSATVRLSEYYAAMRDNDTGEVSGFVALIRWDRDSFGYKDMNESMGPVIADCPARILDLLTPLPDCDHREQYCRHCDTEITGPVDGRWFSQAKPHQNPDVAGPRCYSGYRMSARPADGGQPWHEPGGTASCPVCWARAWRQRCRDNIAPRERRRRLLVDGASVRLVGAEWYRLPPHVAADPTFTVVRAGRRLTFRHGVSHFRFPQRAQWERAS
jgi:hypothetical protein